MSIRRKYPNLRHKWPIYFQALCPRFICFHTHNSFERNFVNIFFCRIPLRTFPKALIRRHIPRKSESFMASKTLSAQIPYRRPAVSRTPNLKPRVPSPGCTRPVSSTQIAISLILGFVNNKVSLVYATHRADKMPTPRGGENRRAKASRSARGGTVENGGKQHPPLGWLWPATLREDAICARDQSYSTSGGFPPEVVVTCDTCFRQKTIFPAN